MWGLSQISVTLGVSTFDGDKSPANLLRFCAKLSMVIIIRSSSLSGFHVHKWILMLTQRPFMWLTAQSSHPLFGSGPGLVFEWVSSVIKISVDGTLGLRVCVRETGSSGLLRWISHDRVLLTLRGWTPRADRQSQQRDRWAGGTGETNLDGWTGGQRARKAHKCFRSSLLLLLFWRFYILYTCFLLIFHG